MKNFFTHVDKRGYAPGCLSAFLNPSPCSIASKHAKPVLIQGSWLASSDKAEFLPFKDQMLATLNFWDREPHIDSETKLFVWSDQMETGADDLPLSQCPSWRSPACWSLSQANTLASVDLQIWLAREHLAFSKFLTAWNDISDAQYHSVRAKQIIQNMDNQLWREHLQYHVALNTSTHEDIIARTYQISLPLWFGVDNSTRNALIIESMSASDLLSPYGLRSTSSEHPQYSNEKVLHPYSNWRGPAWVISNALAAYGLNRQGQRDEALDLASRILSVLADDLRNGTDGWHEAYSSDNGSPLAAPGFFSWNVLSAELLDNIKKGNDPFEL